MDKKQSRATAVTGVEKSANVKDAGKVERKSVPQKKVAIGKEKSHLSMNGWKSIRRLFKKNREKISRRRELIWV